MLDIETKGGDSISFYFVAANFWENVNKGGKGRELMLTRGKKKQKTGERKKQKSRRKEKQGTRQQKTEKLTSKPESGKLKRETEIQKTIQKFRKRKRIDIDTFLPAFDEILMMWPFFLASMPGSTAPILFITP